MATKWHNITRRLDLGLASVETCTEKDKSRGRAITKNRRSFVIPAYFIEHINFTEMLPSRVVIQYNYIAPAPFRLLNAKQISQLVEQQKIPYCVLCITYRVGNTKIRYRLTQLKTSYVWESPFVEKDNVLGSDARHATQTPDGLMPLHGVPVYNNERIPVNFSIELWTYISPWTVSVTTNTLDNPPQGLLEDVELETNLLYNPVSANDIGDVFDNENSIAEAAVETLIEEVLPVDQSELVQWLDNV